MLGVPLHAPYIQLNIGDPVELTEPTGETAGRFERNPKDHHGTSGARSTIKAMGGGGANMSLPIVFP